MNVKIFQTRLRTHIFALNGQPSEYPYKKNRHIQTPQNNQIGINTLLNLNLQLIECFILTV